nr:immunoglobulin light chain junction region [Macaca mulatta]MOX82395.1 immunoglobulin light chain junction region [Macaca mulatta]
DYYCYSGDGNSRLF